MITEIELENIRIFDGKEWSFDLLPLTVFCGTNSVGKSTILKALLLLKQSQSSSATNYGKTNGKLRLAGNIVDLGTYSSFVSNNETEKDISIGLTIRDKLPFEYYQMPSSETEDAHNHSKSNRPLDYLLKSKFTFGIPNNKYEKSQLEENIVAQAVLKKADYKIIVEEEPLLEWYVEIDNTQTDEDNTKADELEYNIIIPTEFFKMVGGLDKLMPKKEENDYVVYSTYHPGIFPYSIFAQEKQKQQVEEELKEAKSKLLVAPMPPIIRDALQDLDSKLSRIDYIPSLRSSPKRYYPIYQETGSTNDIVDYISRILRDILQEKEFHNTVLNIQPCEKTAPKKESFSKALNSWLYYLRVGEKPREDIDTVNSEIEICTLNDVLAEIKIKSTNGHKLYSLADSGFGYSQLLPIVVKTLLVKPDSILLIEEPELHLNPAVQVRLAEFLVAMMRTNKQIIIETHSEYIVDTIRVLTAEDESGELVGKCGILFIDTQLEKPVVRELSIQPDGTIPDLPRHFFGEAISLSGRLLRAQRRFRTPVKH